MLYRKCRCFYIITPLYGLKHRSSIISYTINLSVYQADLNKKTNYYQQKGCLDPKIKFYGLKTGLLGNPQGYRFTRSNSISEHSLSLTYYFHKRKSKRTEFKNKSWNFSQILKISSEEPDPSLTHFLRHCSSLICTLSPSKIQKTLSIKNETIISAWISSRTLPKPANYVPWSTNQPIYQF